MTSIKINIKSIKNIFLVIILYGFLFNIRIYEFINTQRIAVFISIIYCIYKSKQVKNIIHKEGIGTYQLFAFMFVVQIMFVVVRSFGIDTVSNGNTLLTPIQLLQVFLAVVIFSIFLYLAFDRELNILGKCYLLCMDIESVIILLGVVFPEIETFIYTNCYSGDDRFLSSIFISGTRFIGPGVVASGGSMIMFTGVCMALYLMKKKIVSTKCFLLHFVLILMACFFVGRTGTFASILVLLYFLFTERNLKTIIIVISLPILLVGILTWILDTKQSDQTEYIMQWGLQLLDADRRFNTLEILQKSDIPGLSIYTLFGTNLLRGTTMGLTIQNDSGYVEMYAAIGVICAFFYYTIFYIFLLHGLIQSKLRDRLYIIFICIILMVAEYKEPYTLQIMVPFVIVLIKHFEYSLACAGDKKNQHLIN